MAGTASPISRSLHPHLCFVAQSGGDLVQYPYPPGGSARFVPQGVGAHRAHRTLHGQMERQRTPFRVDGYGRFHPRENQETLRTNLCDTTLVDGKQTWEHADEKKHDIECMKRCCDAELKTMESIGLVAAPYYFERVAILSRKARNFRQELHYCETYIRLVENFYQKNGTEGIADVRKGPTFQAIAARIPKARELLAKSEQAAERRRDPKAG